MYPGKNSVELSGIVESLDIPRWTPSGLSVSSGVLLHSSKQEEVALGFVDVSFGIPFIAIGQLASFFSSDIVNESVELSGFLVYTKKVRGVGFAVRVSRISLSG